MSFAGLRLEYGRPEDGEDLADFVLKQIEDRTLINEGVNAGANAVTLAIENGIDSAMNKYN